MEEENIMENKKPAIGKKPVAKKPAAKQPAKVIDIKSEEPKKAFSETDLEKNTIVQTKKALDAQPKYEIYIPSSETAKDDINIGINGHNYIIRRDNWVSVPESVVSVLTDASITTYDQVKRSDGEGYELVSREVQRFPFSSRKAA